jgi:hypothetical protein
MPGFVTYDFFLYDALDNSKQLKFDTSALTTGSLLTLAVPWSSPYTTTTILTRELPGGITGSMTTAGGLTVGQSVAGPSLIALAGTGSTDVLRVKDETNTTTFWSIDGYGIMRGDNNTRSPGLADVSSAGAVRFATAALTQDRILTVADLDGTIPVVGNDPPAVASGALGKVDLTAQVADIGSTNLSNTPPAGFYVIHAVLEDTTADITAGAVTVTFAWTDDVGATTDATLTQTLVTTGRSRITIPIYVASGNISYSTSHTGIFGTSAYALRIRVLALG